MPERSSPSAPSPSSAAETLGDAPRSTGGFVESVPASGPALRESFDGDAAPISLSKEIAAEVPSPPPARDTGSTKDFIADILARGPDSAAYRKHGVGTTVHESTHDINRILRRKHGGVGTGLYFGEGRSAWFEEPSVTKAQAAAFIPEDARRMAHRYREYIVSSEHADHIWNLMDEWSAYVNEARAVVETAPSGEWRNGEPNVVSTDIVDGSADFLMFCGAALAAIRKSDPGYFERAPESKAIFRDLAERTARYVSAGVAFTEPDGNRPFGRHHAAAMMTTLAKDPQAAPIRAAFTSLFGAAWTSSVLGF